MKYYIVENGRAVGPFEPYELMTRGLTSRSFVWNKTMSRWTQAGHVPELQSLLSGGVTFDNGSAYGYLAQAKYGPAAEQPPRRRVVQRSAPRRYAAPQRRSNGLGVAGFILSMVSVLLVLFSLVSVANYAFYSASVFVILVFVVSILAFIFSLIGVFRRPRGLAIAGLAVSGVFMVIYLLSIFPMN